MHLKGVDAKIVVLCRTDLLDKIADPNKNKIVQDRGIFLEWYEGERQIENSNLTKLVNLRASIALQREVNVFSEFFPPTLKEDKPTIKVLFDFTRNTPRDLIMLLTKIQKHTTKAKPTLDEVWDGINEYSTHYFRGEIHDELVGFLDDAEISKAFELLRAMGRTQYHLTVVENKVKSTDRFNLISGKLPDVFSVLYNCSAIGNFNNNTGVFSWKYWNTETFFQPNRHISVHQGLHKVLDLKFNYIPRKTKQRKKYQF